MLGDRRELPRELPIPRLGCFSRQARVSRPVPQTRGLDDEHERRVRLLLLSKAAVLAHRFDRPLAAEMDESEQRSTAAGH